MAFRDIKLCSSCKYGDNDGNLYLEVGGEIVHDLLSVPVGYEGGTGSAVLFGTDGKNRKKKVFVAEVNGDFTAAAHEADNLQERAKECGGQVGLLCFKSCGAGLTRVGQVSPSNGMEGYVIK